MQLVICYKSHNIETPAAQTYLTSVCLLTAPRTFGQIHSNHNFLNDPFLHTVGDLQREPLHEEPRRPAHSLLAPLESYITSFANCTLYLWTNTLKPKFRNDPFLHTVVDLRREPLHEEPRRPAHPLLAPLESYITSFANCTLYLWTNTLKPKFRNDPFLHTVGDLWREPLHEVSKRPLSTYSW
jgi:hypothetical protein